MNISSKDLQKIYKDIIQKLILSGQEEIFLNTDYYWVIPDNEREYTQKEPVINNIGSLEDDWLELQKILKRDFTTALDLERFAHLLLAIAAKLKKEKIKI